MSTVPDLSTIPAGFDDPVLNSQSTFRLVLDALSRPGRISKLDVQAAPEGFNFATAGLALCLFDFNTPIFLSPLLRTEQVESWIRFHCSAPITTIPAEADFAVLAKGDSWPNLMDFNRGSEKYPDASTSLILQVQSLDQGRTITISGPGNKAPVDLEIEGLPEHFWAARADAVSDFQLGLDCFFTAENAVLGLPRSNQHTLKAGA
ncbi:MAG: phosphonate C-P lyase system protein PhnH [Pseudomonadota bacterium]